MANTLMLSVGALMLFLAVSYKVLSKTNESKANMFERGQQNQAKADEFAEKYSKVFSKEKVIKVRDGVYVAFGFSLANMIMLEGKDGIIIVDTTDSAANALRAYEEFRKITKKPLKGIIMTHFHADHIRGASALLQASNHSGNNVKVYTHSTTAIEYRRFLTFSDIAYKRASRQFGTYLQRDIKQVNSTGIGPKLRMLSEEIRVVEATHVFDDEITEELAGITFQLIHTPGETDDQITVWIPEWKVVLPADNIYKAFPNLSPIRGSPPRRCDVWYRSLDKVRHLQAEYMVPSHTVPVTGQQQVYDIITHYRDGIQFICDQTTRLMNKGLSVDEIVERVKLPKVLADHPYLQQYYGKISWSVRSVYNGEMGWFNGDPININPLPSKKGAKRLLELVGSDYPALTSGVDKLLYKARQCMQLSLKEKNSSGNVLIEELQWALELSSIALDGLDESASFIYKDAKQLKIAALKALGRASINANARNYYLTSAFELETGVVIEINPTVKYQARKYVKISTIMSFFSKRFRAEDCDETEVMTVIFHFPDIKQTHGYTMRHCVLEYNYDTVYIPKQYDVKVTMTSGVWRSVLMKKRNVAMLIATGDVVIDGKLHYFKHFMDLIKE